MERSGVHKRRTTPHVRPKKVFTVEQAHRALPLVRRIVADVVAQYRELLRLEALRVRLDYERHRRTAAKLDRRATEGVSRLNDLVREIGDIGCELKDWEQGVVDFPALRDGRPVYLCWKLGEDTIRHWHETHAGMSTRQPIEQIP